MKCSWWRWTCSSFWTCPSRLAEPRPWPPAPGPQGSDSPLTCTRLLLGEWLKPRLNLPSRVALWSGQILAKPRHLSFWFPPVPIQRDSHSPRLSAIVGISLAGDSLLKLVYLTNSYWVSLCQRWCQPSPPSWVFLWLGIPFLSLSTWQILTEFRCVRGDVNQSMKTFSAKSFPPPFPLPCCSDLGTVPQSLNSTSVLGPQTQHFLSVFLVESEAKVWGQYGTRLKLFFHHFLHIHLG